MKPGLIGFIQGETFWQDLEKLAKLGYKGMDSDAMMAPGDESMADKAKKMRDLGIEPLTVSSGFDLEKRTMSVSAIKKDIDRIVKACKEQGLSRCTLWGGSAITSFTKGYGNNGTYEELMEDIDAMNYAIPKLADEGIVLAYHNHYQEFTVYHKGVASIDYMLALTDERLNFDLDVGWATVAGQDPVEVMKRVEGRIAVVHYKDIFDVEACKRMGGVIATDSSTGFTALGTGLLEVGRVAIEADRQGIEWGIVEQDRLRNLDTMQALTMAYYSFKETGLFE